MAKKVEKKPAKKAAPAKKPAPAKKAETAKKVAPAKRLLQQNQRKRKIQAIVTITS